MIQMKKNKENEQKFTLTKIDKNWPHYILNLKRTSIKEIN